MSKYYEDAGVSLEAGYESVALMKKHVKRTERLGVMGGIGSFGGLFDLSALQIKEPVLVSGTDGVGTKLKLAFDLDKHDTIGIDAVAMCVNDIIAQGAAPLYFLDYIAVSKNEPTKIEAIVKGICDGCVQAGCALIGGETAEMPGLYGEGEYDIAGFAVGAVEKSRLITGNAAKAGDIVIGLASSGVHSNGFSLVRKILTDQNINLHSFEESLQANVGDALMVPTRIYVKSVLAVLQHVNVQGIAHITGGGFHENMPRCIDSSLGISIQNGSWTIPPIFHYLQKLSGMPFADMYHVFNMGIGMILVVAKEDAEKTLQLLAKQNETATCIGVITDKSGVQFHD